MSFLSRRKEVGANDAESRRRPLIILVQYTPSAVAKVRVGIRIRVKVRSVDRGVGDLDL